MKGHVLTYCFGMEFQLVYRNVVLEGQQFLLPNNNWTVLSSETDSSHRLILCIMILLILMNVDKLGWASRKCLPAIVQVFDFFRGRHSSQCLVPMWVSSKLLNNHFMPLLKVKGHAQ